MNEAIVNQIPILGIPIFSDQYRNIANAVYLGIGLSLDYNSLDKNKFLLAAREIINNEKYVLSFGHMEICENNEVINISYHS